MNGREYLVYLFSGDACVSMMIRLRAAMVDVVYFMVTF